MTHSIEVPLFLKSLSQRIKTIQDYQTIGYKTGNEDFDRGHRAACEQILSYLAQEELNWSYELAPPSDVDRLIARGIYKGGNHNRSPR